MPARQIKDRNEFIDIMTSMKGRKFITYGYVTGVELPNMPKKMVPNPEYGIKPRVRKEKSVGDWEALGNEMGFGGAIGGIIRFTTYNCQYSNNDEISKAYADYGKKRDEIRAKYGIGQVGKAAYGTGTFDYGSGVRQYGGENADNAGHLYSDQNLYHSTKNSRYFVVGRDGIVDTSHELSYGQFKQYLKQSKPFEGNPAHKEILDRIGGSDSGYSQLVKMGADDATITGYLKDIDALKMDYKRFVFDKIVFMVGKVGGEHFYYFNKDVATVVKNLDVDVDMRSFLNLATEKYKDSIQDLDSLHDSALEEEIGNSASRIIDEVFGKRPVVFDGSGSLDDKMIDEAVSGVIRRMKENL